MARNYPHTRSDGQELKVLLRCGEQRAGSVHMLMDPAKRERTLLVTIKTDVTGQQSLSGYCPDDMIMSAAALPGSKIYSTHHNSWTEVGNVTLRQQGRVRQLIINFTAAVELLPVTRKPGMNMRELVISHPLLQATQTPYPQL